MPPPRKSGRAANLQSIVRLRDDINPWERQEPHETEKMFSRFLVFRDLGPDTDRLRQTAEVLNSTGDKLSIGTLRSYASNFRWSPRAAAWDRYAMQADRSRMMKFRREAIDDQRKMARTLRLRALEALQMLPSEDMSPTDIVRFAELSYKIEHSLFADYAQSVIDNEQANSANAGQVVDIAGWSPAERHKRLEELRTELTNRAVRAADDDEVAS